ncbi:hypothetical protein [Streptomyces sp. NPDC091278]|uniref:hypothetical protein n=1 Tax=Streptomyces sp. NPDC091278 TaxID=3155301 RepID=UPI00344BC3F9
MPASPRSPERTPKVYTSGTGRPAVRPVDAQAKVTRAVNVVGLVWEQGKARAREDQVSLSHAVEVLLEAYSAGLVDIGALSAQLDELAEARRAASS